MQFLLGLVGKFLFTSQLQPAEKVNIFQPIYKKKSAKTIHFAAVTLARPTNRLKTLLSHVLCNIPQFTCKMSDQHLIFILIFFNQTIHIPAHQLKNEFPTHSKCTTNIQRTWTTAISAYNITLSKSTTRYRHA